MRGEREREKKEVVRVELKYCERCGGLWLRECGEGTVYCGNCAGKVADLPVPKRKRIKMPVRPRSLVERYDDLLNERDLEAAGGAA